ncbi:MAG: trypsin-like peptidase domain-containing protein, partial [Gemmatimonadota bacterium]
MADQAEAAEQPPAASAVAGPAPSDAPPTSTASRATPPQAAPSSSVDASRTTAIVRAANRVSPAVVNVSVIASQPVQSRSMWEDFFLPPGARRRTAGFGSGVIVRSDGVILTNDHVVRNAQKIKVTLSDGRDFDAELVGTDQVADIAVLRIQGDNLPVAPVGTSQGLLIGEWA